MTRRRFLIRNGAGALLVPSMTPFALAQEFSKTVPSEKKEKPSVFRAAEFNHIALDTPHRETAIAFYEKTFGMTNISHGRTVRDTFLHFDKGFMNLGETETAGLNHFCLGIENFERDIAFRMLSMLDLKPFLMGGNNLHIYDPDGFNVQVQEIGHGYGRIDSSELTQSKKGLMETAFIHHISVTVSDVARSRDFYREMFGLQLIGSQDNDHCILAVGSGFLELRKGLKPSMNHFCLAINDFRLSTVISKLKESGMESVTDDASLVSFKDSSGLEVKVTSADRISKR